MPRWLTVVPEGRAARTVVIAMVVVATLLVGTAVVIARHSRSDRSAAGPVGPAAPGGPTSHPEARCGNKALDGPDTPPAGAVTISTGESASQVVQQHDPGTTYWFAPGVHHLSSGRYDQVIPEDGDTFLGAPGAVLDGEHQNLYAFGGHAADVTIRFLTVQNFGAPGLNNNEGVVNHDSAEGWTVASSTLQRNAGAAVMLGSRDTLTGNCLRDNGQYGFSAYHPDGVRDVTLDDNEIAGNNTDDWEVRQPGCGCSGGGKFWATHGGKVTGNWVHDNNGVGLWADNNNVDFLFQRNYVAGNAAEGLMYETSYNAAILDNTFVRNGLVKGPKNRKFPTSAIYLSESGSDPRLGGAYGDEFRIAGNRFEDNWSGVVAWENADRFAGSPANTSTGQTPLVNPRVATLQACSQAATVATKPYFDDCRWKTQNILVTGNLFSIDPTHIPLCARSTGCGFNGLFSNYGSYPRWSPYKAKIVSDNLTFHQHNRWQNNTYEGDWQFMAAEMGNVVSWDKWRAGPYNQDSDSRVS